MNVPGRALGGCSSLWRTTTIRPISTLGTLSLSRVGLVFVGWVCGVLGLLRVCVLVGYRGSALTNALDDDIIQLFSVAHAADEFPEEDRVAMDMKSDQSATPNAHCIAFCWTRQSAAKAENHNGFLRSLSERNSFKKSADRAVGWQRTPIVSAARRAPGHARARVSFFCGHAARMPGSPWLRESTQTRRYSALGTGNFLTAICAWLIVSRV